MERLSKRFQEMANYLKEGLKFFPLIDDNYSSEELSEIELEQLIGELENGKE